MNTIEPSASVDQRNDLEWVDLLRSGTAEALCSEWLDRLGEQFKGARRALVLLRSEQDVLQLVASRPAGARVDDLAALLSTAAAGCSPACRELGDGWLLTAPLVWSGQVSGLVALHLADRAGVNEALKALNWGCGWLMALLARVAHDRERAGLSEARRLLDLITVVLAEPDFASATLAIANRLSTVWKADGVMVGWVQLQRTAVVARSNASDSDGRANLLGLATAAMDEALDLRTTLQWQSTATAPTANGSAVVLPEHRALARETRADAIATALLFDQGVAVGTLLLERDHPFSDAELEVLDTHCMLLAPLLAQRRAADRSLLQHAKASARSTARNFSDSSFLGWKLVATAAALLLLLTAILPIPFRIGAAAVVEGEVQRSISAPFQGFIRSAVARAGDVVRNGQLLATLEDKDLQLDAARWTAELDLATRKEREAMAAGNRVDLRLAAAQANQALAQLGLVQEKLKRVQITAPFDGVVLRGDLSQSLGSPVEQGKVLFELAPLDAWRVILKVDERDIGQLRLQQHGELMLAGLTGSRQPFTVTRITSVAVAEEGRNHFRVEADLTRHDVKLRPGMEGVAKVDAGSASALWIWTRRMADWLRLTLWEWSP